MCRQRARSHTPFVATSVNAGINGDGWFAPNIQRANALGTVYFMRRYAHQIETLRFDI